MTNGDGHGPLRFSVRCDRQIGSVPFVRLQLLLAPVVEVCLRLWNTEPLRERIDVLRCAAYLLAARIAFETVADARLGSDLRVRARAHALHSEVSARSGRRRDAVTSLRLAWSDLDVAGAANGGFNEGLLQGFEGVCELHVGTAERAHDQLEQSLAAVTAPRDQVQRGIVDADLAVARLRCGDVRAAVTLLHDCVEITAATGGRVTAQRNRPRPP